MIIHDIHLAVKFRTLSIGGQKSALLSCACPSRGPTLSLDLNDKISFSMYNAPNARGDGPQVRFVQDKAHSVG